MCTGPVLFQHGAIPDTAVDLYLGEGHDWQTGWRPCVSGGGQREPLMVSFGRVIDRSTECV